MADELMMLSCVDLDRTICLRFIDPYGDTIFNRGQMKVLVDELALIGSVFTDERVRQAYDDWLMRFDKMDAIQESCANIGIALKNIVTTSIHMKPSFAKVDGRFGDRTQPPLPPLYWRLAGKFRLMWGICPMQEFKLICPLERIRRSSSTAEHRFRKAGVKGSNPSLSALFSPSLPNGVFLCLFPPWTRAGLTTNRPSPSSPANGCRTRPYQGRWTTDAFAAPNRKCLCIVSAGSRGHGNFHRPNCWQFLYRSCHVEDARIGINVHRQPHIGVTHQAHCYTWSNADFGQHAAVGVSQGVEIRPPTLIILISNPRLIQIPLVSFH